MRTVMLHLPVRYAETCDLGDLFAFIVMPRMFVLGMFEEPAFWGFSPWELQPMWTCIR